MADDVIMMKVVRDDLNKLRGELFGAVELAGLPQAQEDAFKKLIRWYTYDAQNHLEAAIREG